MQKLLRKLTILVLALAFAGAPWPSWLLVTSTPTAT